MVQASGWKDWIPVRFFRNLWFFLKMSFLEVYADNVNWFRSKMRRKAPLSGRNRDVKEKTNVNFQTQRIMNSFSALKMFFYKCMYIDMCRKARIDGKAPNARVLKYDTKQEISLLDFMCAGRPLVVIFGSCS
ncbi:thyroxine 5'-deiodinase-like isoform X1 [Clavelina lepadiformis]|uniref:thyroxine 5'-deiodinase-like isoform X1 n=1 Tax=Clavelina lepadiformis TaxID=159417 RepID=UPI00404298FD